MLVTLLAQVIVLAVAALDYRTGTRFQFAIIYLIPVTIAALLGGVRSGVITGLSSTAAWFAADALVGAHQGTGWLPYWNAFSRLAGFLLIAVLLSRSKELNRRLVEKAQGLSLEIEKRKRTEKIYADEKDILQDVACDRPLLEILEALTRKIEQWYAGMLCSLFLYDGENNRFVCAVAPSLPPDLRKEIQERSLDRTLPSGRAAHSASDVLLFDLTTDPAWADFRQIARHYQLNPRCSKAILSPTGDLLGMLVIFAPQSEGMTLSDLALFEKARDIASIAIERSRLNKELRKLSELIIEAQEAERRRIARDLHDSVNQVLSSVTFRIGMMDSKSAGLDQEVNEELQRTKVTLTKVIDEIHRISEDLRPSELDALGLVPAVRELCTEFQSKTNLALKFESQLSAKRLPDVLELTLYRIIQEALNNIEKHSRATEATLHLGWDGSFIELTIHDNGKGLEPASERVNRPKKSGMGLLNMRERTAFLGGIFSIQPLEGKGTQIVVRIPLAKSDPFEEVTG